jgi:CIC family chloride channel protein
MARQHHIGYPVLNHDGEPVGVVTMEEAAKVSKEKRATTLVGQICRKPVAVFPRETGLEAFKKMSQNETGRVLVLDSADPKKLLGMITKADLMHTIIRQN